MLLPTGTVVSLLSRDFLDEDLLASPSSVSLCWSGAKCCRVPDAAVPVLSLELSGCSRIVKFNRKPAPAATHPAAQG